MWTLKWIQPYFIQKARNTFIDKTRELERVKEQKIALSVKKINKITPKPFIQYIASKTSYKEGISDLLKKAGALT